MSIGGFLGGVTQLGTQVFNARAQADERIEEKKREEEEREQQRRLQALQMAVTELNLEQAKRKFPMELANLRRGGARDDLELERMRDGLPPTPGQPRPTPSELEAEAHARTVGSLTGQAEVLRNPDNRAVLESARNNRPDAPPSFNEVRTVTRDVVDSLLQQDPMMDADAIFESITNPDWLAEQDPAVRLLIEGGRINRTAIQAALRRYGDNAMPDDLRSRLDRACERAQEQGIAREEAFNATMNNVRGDEEWAPYAENAARYFRNTCQPGIM